MYDVAEVWVKMNTFQMSALFYEHFYTASGFCWRTLYINNQYTKYCWKCVCRPTWCSLPWVTPPTRTRTFWPNSRTTNSTLASERRTFRLVKKREIDRSLNFRLHWTDQYIFTDFWGDFAGSKERRIKERDFTFQRTFNKTQQGRSRLLKMFHSDHSKGWKNVEFEPVEFWLNI